MKEKITLFESINNKLSCWPGVAENIFLIPGFEPISSELNAFKKRKGEKKLTKNDFTGSDMRIKRSSWPGLTSRRTHHEVPAIIRARSMISFVIWSWDLELFKYFSYSAKCLPSLSALKNLLHVLSLIFASDAFRISIKSRRVKNFKSWCATSFISGSSIFWMIFRKILAVEESSFSFKYNYYFLPFLDFTLQIVLMLWISRYSFSPQLLISLKSNRAVTVAVPNKRIKNINLISQTRNERVREAVRTPELQDL